MFRKTLFGLLYLLITVTTWVASDVAYYGEPEQGKSLVIDCFFGESKVTGNVRWRLNGTITTSQCTVLPQYQDFLQPHEYCNGTNSRGAENYTFNITSLSRVRDMAWTCESPYGNDPLSMNITVDGGVNEDTVQPMELSEEDPLQLSVMTGCSYPAEIAEWCILIQEENEKCYPADIDWWRDVFHNQPTIEQNPSDCDPAVYGPDVKQYELKLDGVLEKGGKIEGRFYMKFMDVTYLDYYEGQPLIQFVLGFFGYQIALMVIIPVLVLCAIAGSGFGFYKYKTRTSNSS